MPGPFDQAGHPSSVTKTEPLSMKIELAPEPRLCEHGCMRTLLNCSLTVLAVLGMTGIFASVAAYFVVRGRGGELEDWRR